MILTLKKPKIMLTLSVDMPRATRMSATLREGRILMRVMTSFGARLPYLTEVFNPTVTTIVLSGKIYASCIVTPI